MPLLDVGPENGSTEIRPGRHPSEPTRTLTLTQTLTLTLTQTLALTR